jgi:hypothetical protein
MAAFSPYVVECSCGTAFRVDLAESINVKRMPQLRDEILAGRLHRAACPTCWQEATVEKPFFYTDPDRHAYYNVKPRGERHLWKEATRELTEAMQSVPSSTSPLNKRKLRVVFGMDELREKLLAEDAYVDDHMVELLKVSLAREHPFILGHPRLRLHLDEHSPDALTFSVAYEHHPQRFSLSVPRTTVDRILANEPALSRRVVEAQPSGPLFSPDSQWVNMWRLSPHPDALKQLKTLGQSLDSGDEVDMGSPEVSSMLRRLPHGSHLSAWAKKVLDVMFEEARRQRLEEVQSKIFDVRFDHELSDDWARNENPNDIATLWQLFKSLPSSSVELNSQLNEIILGGGKKTSLYEASSRDIFINANDMVHLGDFKRTVRHEVGHSVQQELGDVVDKFLTRQFGWKNFKIVDDGNSDGNIDKWVGLMGGWGNLNEAQRRDARQQLRAAVKPAGKWEPTVVLPLQPANHPWNDANFGPRLALEKSTSGARNRYWFNNFKHWHTHEGLRFCVNFFYGSLMAVPIETLDLVAKMPRQYAAMSPEEFFAETYAAFFDPDHDGRSIFPREVATWFDEHVESR